MLCRNKHDEYVAINAYSIAEAYFHPEAWFRGIYAGDTPIGFVMLEDWSQVSADRADDPTVLWRYMIDHRFQGFGHGKRHFSWSLTVRVQKRGSTTC